MFIACDAEMDNGGVIGIDISEEITDAHLDLVTYEYPKDRSHPDFNLKEYNKYYKDSPCNYSVSLGLCNNMDVQFHFTSPKELIALGEALIKSANLIQP